MTSYQHPRSLPRSLVYALRINGQAVEVLHTGVADFAIAALAESDLPARVEVSVLKGSPSEGARVRPACRQIACQQNGETVSFDLIAPLKVSLEMGGGMKPIYLFLGAPEQEPPRAGEPEVVTFPAGQVTEKAVLDLEDGQTLYLPGGAVFKGMIRARNARNIRICGHGIVDGSFYDRSRDCVLMPGIVLEKCSGIRVEEITMVRPSGWMLVTADCEDVGVRDIRQIGEVVSSDGIDVVGSRRVRIEDCFLHNNDDCVVIKAFDIAGKNLPGAGVIRGRADVDDVLVERCVLANWEAGNAMEIGHELSTDFVRNIIFRDIDVLHVHAQGAVFSLHNYGRALIEKVLFENIRIEHCWDKFIDFRISRSRFSNDDEYGHIRDVVLRYIHWEQSDFNAGYTISLIGGRDASHRIENVTLENICLKGRPVRDLDELEIHLRHTDGIKLV